MKNARGFLMVAGSGIILAIFLATTVVPATSQVSLVSPIPRPAEDLPFSKPSLSLPPSVPDTAEGIKLIAKTDKAIYNSGENGVVSLTFRNNDDKPMTTTTLYLGYQIIPKDGSIGYTIKSHQLFAPDYPFTVPSGAEVSVELPWSVLKVDENGTSEPAPSGEYIIRTFVLEPFQIISETTVEVR